MSSKSTPAHKEAEIGLISRLFVKPSRMNLVADRVRPEHFYYDDLRQIYDAMYALSARGKSPSVPAVADELIRRGDREGTARDVEYELENYKHDLEDIVKGDIDDYVDQIRRASRNRRLIAAAEAIVGAAYRQDENSLDLAEQLIMAIAMDTSEVEADSMADMLDRFELEYKRRVKEREQGRIQGVRTGFRDIDKMMVLRPGGLNVLAALTSVGKTAFALNVAFNIIKHAGGRVLFFSLEMTEYELMQRFAAMEAHVDQTRIRDGQIDPDEHQSVLAAIKSLRPLDFHATDKAFRLDTIKSVARYAHMHKPVDLIVVDYLQMVDAEPSERGSRQKAAYEEISDISRGLKRLAQQLNAPVLALAQLSKEATRKERPDLSDIAGAYQIARDCDTLSILSVPKEELEKRMLCQPYGVDFEVVKERNGRIGSARVMFIPPQTRFADTEF